MRFTGPEFQTKPSTPTVVEGVGVLDEVMNSIGNPAFVPLGSATASAGLFPNARLNRIINRIARRDSPHSARYEPLQGLEPLRRQIARRAAAYGGSLSPKDVTVTCGGMEALNLAVRAVARPGDVIAIESLR